MSVPTVSVVIPAYNRGDTIDAALASVRAQIRPPDDIVIVDDASTDDTASRVASWADQLTITLLRNDVNIGCGASRARAVAAATGDVIAPLDGDDVWLPDHLSTVLPLASDPSIIVATRPVRWLPNLGMDPRATSATSVPPPDRQPEEILRHNFLFSGSLAWRSAVDGIGGGSVARRSDDWETWIRLIIEGGCRAVSAGHATVLYRSHPASLSVLDACLPEDVDLCERLLATPGYQPYAAVLESSRRRRLARREFLEGARAGADGDTGAARRAFLRALRTDPSLTGLLEPGTTGSVALRAGMGLAAPRLAAAARQRRLERKALINFTPADTSSSPDPRTPESGVRS
jgi:hypothetical protein